MASSSNVGGPVPVPSSNSTEGVDRVKLVFDIEEDVVAELQEFVRLSHSGLFLDAQALFDECLSPYDRWFPALAEYCDNLLRQGRYGDLRAVSADAITKFDDAHKSQLFTLMEVIAKVHQEGSVNDSFEQVWNIWRSIPIPDKGSDAKLGIKSHLLEIYLQIAVLIQNNSKLTAEMTQLPGGQKHDRMWQDFEELFWRLLNQEYIWEAHRILLSLLVVLPWEKTERLRKAFLRKASKMDDRGVQVEEAVSSMVTGLIRHLVDRNSSTYDTQVVPTAIVEGWTHHSADKAKSPPASSLPTVKEMIRRAAENGDLTALQYLYRREVFENLESQTSTPNLTLALASIQRLSALQCNIMEDSLSEREVRNKIRRSYAESVPSLESDGPIELTWNTRQIAEFLSKKNGKSESSIKPKESRHRDRFLWQLMSCTGNEAKMKAVTQKLLEHRIGIDVGILNQQTGHTALHVAAANGWKEVAEWLLDHGANAELVDWLGWTAMQTAAANGQPEIVELLLNRGANPNVAVPLVAGSLRNHVISDDLEWGITPLICAAEAGHRDVARLLIGGGAHPGINSDQVHSSRTAILYAAQSGHEAIVELLLESGANVEVKDPLGQTPLWRAAVNGHDDSVMLLLEKGANVKVKDSLGQTPLCGAAANGHEAIVRLLLRKGADPKAKSNLGHTPLFWAAKNGHEAVVRLLLENGGNVEVKDSEWDQTPLLWAAKNGYKAIVRLLLEKGADLEAKSNLGHTPLFWAAENGHKAVVRLLLENSANVEVKDRSGQTPLLRAAKNGHEAVVRLLLENGGNVEVKDSEWDQTPLLWAAKNGYKAIVRLLLKKGADLEAKSNLGHTSLLWAVENEHEAVVRLLLENGANAEVKDRSGQTPLLRAAKNGHEAVVRLLLENGANVEAKDNLDQTPLHRAAEYGHAAVVGLLIKEGADVEAKDKNGQTPRSLARRTDIF